MPKYHVTGIDFQAIKKGHDALTLPRALGSDSGIPKIITFIGAKRVNLGAQLAKPFCPKPCNEH
jgi:hypothetical protein